MRIDGLSSQSYLIKRKPRKAALRNEDVGDDIDGDFVDVEALASEQARSRQAAGSLPARQQDMIFHRSVSKRAANALASYLTTAGFVEWDMEVLGLDVHI